MIKKDYCFLIDTSFDIIDQTFEENVYFLRPEIIRTKGNDVQTFQDGEDISRDDIVYSLDNKYDLKTSQTPYGVIESTLVNLLHQYQTIFVILITKEFSGMYETCCKCARMLENDYGKNRILVLNSRSISMFQNILMREVKTMYENNVDLKEIERYTKNYYKKTYAFTIITNANQLIKGGRLTGLKAVLVKAFNIKLLIEYANGKLKYLDKAKDIYKVIDLGLKSMENYLDLKHNQIEEIAIYSDLDDNQNQVYAEYIKNKFIEYYQGNYPMRKLPAIIITHLGNKSLSLLCKIK